MVYGIYYYGNLGFINHHQGSGAALQEKSPSWWQKMNLYYSLPNLPAKGLTHFAISPFFLLLGLNPLNMLGKTPLTVDNLLQHPYLVGGWATLLKNMSLSVGMMKLLIYGTKFQIHQPDLQINPVWPFWPSQSLHHLSSSFMKNIIYSGPKWHVLPPSGSFLGEQTSGL